MKRWGLLFFLMSACCISYGIQQWLSYNIVSRANLADAKRYLKDLKVDERADLEVFFEYANLFCQYPYTFVHSKPLSICNFYQDAPDLPKICRQVYEKPKLRERYDSLERGLKALKKVAAKLECQNFMLIDYSQSASTGLREVAIIDVNLLNRAIRENKKDFVSVIGYKATDEEIFHMLTNPGHPKFYELMENDLILGIVLGFGRNNARLFQLKERDRLQSFTNEWPYWPRKWRLPCFASDRNSEESIKLMLAYKKARKMIRWTFFGQNQAEVSIALICQDA